MLNNSLEMVTMHYKNFGEFQIRPELDENSSISDSSSVCLLKSALSHMRGLAQNNDIRVY